VVSRLLARGEGDKLGNLNFGVKDFVVPFASRFSFRFFMRYLKTKRSICEAWMYVTGLNEWRRPSTVGRQESATADVYLRADGRLNNQAPTEDTP